MDTSIDVMIRVEVQEYEDIFSAYSDDVPGLHVAGETLDLTRKYIMQATRLLFKYNRDMDVDVLPVGVTSVPDENGRRVEEFIIQRLAA